MMRVIAPICAEDTLETVPNGSGEKMEEKLTPNITMAHSPNGTMRKKNKLCCKK